VTPRITESHTQHTHPSLTGSGTSPHEALTNLPLFNPTGIPNPTPAGNPTSGLDLLAAAAAAALKPPKATLFSNDTTGTFNPAASLPLKIVKKILDLEFVEMSEITIDKDHTQTPGRLPSPLRPPIDDISIWIERFSLMAAILVTRFPDKAPELIVYQATIV
jgi:hypothetical protein